jgi:uncharacterized glyoxalase superfamily protein PhnB
MTAPQLGNLVPYLFYADIDAMIDWYARVFGFVEKERWRGEDGTVHNAEMRVGDTELWMDGANPARHQRTDRDGNPLSPWIGVWLTDREAVDAMYEHIVSEGVEPTEPPRDLPYGVRAFNVSDPEGYSWGFMCHIARPDPAQA